jgi:hypothetical protein
MTNRGRVLKALRAHPNKALSIEEIAAADQAGVLTPVKVAVAAEQVLNRYRAVTQDEDGRYRLAA